ncbi:hypothetical protein DSM03_101695 [Leeuwenhoekiella aestuarii]|uniref:Uncharacterized protein n=1 Tax=Leeuwenhoekiella aestuarii TaxID=2249426 RepID=A0A4Q0NYY0_9FLAO|nr:hypothetical protein [Leeuwenhoekiella aestuarii]RXG18017.1 hypothetical protein DSM04_101203 [Leeuwenhoekiella aestuarii]RXG19323.1 hypothetical protein DSM03_101695 [Leeuwenhoekiella aestuarii]
MKKVFCTLFLDEEKGSTFYELGYFIGSNLFYILLFIVLVLAGIYGLKAFRKNKLK